MWWSFLEQLFYPLLRSTSCQASLHCWLCPLLEDYKLVLLFWQRISARRSINSAWYPLKYYPFFTVELSYFLWRKREFIRSQTFTIKRIRCKFLQTFNLVQSVVLFPLVFKIEFRSLYQLSNCNYSFFCISVDFFSGLFLVNLLRF